MEEGVCVPALEGSCNAGHSPLDSDARVADARGNSSISKSPTVQGGAAGGGKRPQVGSGGCTKVPSPQGEGLDARGF